MRGDGSTPILGGAEASPFRGFTAGLGLAIIAENNNRASIVISGVDRMQSYETSAMVEGEGRVRVSGVPFAPGTHVEVSIYPQRRSAAEFAAAWQNLCQSLRNRPEAGQLSDAEIEQEIHDHRAGR